MVWLYGTENTEKSETERRIIICQAQHYKTFLTLITTTNQADSGTNKEDHAMLKFEPIYKGKIGYTPSLYEREQTALEYLNRKRKFTLDFSEVGGYGIASALLFLLATAIL